MSDFDDIRPYNDAEVPAVLERLIADHEFLDLLLARKAPRLCKFLPWIFKPLARPFIQRSLHRLTSDVHTVADFQSHMTVALKDILDRTTEGYGFGGLDNIEPSKAYLFMSNHRDIALDPAMVNLALIMSDLKTVRIAIGDNLLRKPYASDLMRVNRSFIVKRSVTSRRDKLEALKTLSRYIRYSITSEQTSCWIAQAEGRAKSGRDQSAALSGSDGRVQAFGDRAPDYQIMTYRDDGCDQSGTRNGRDQVMARLTGADRGSRSAEARLRAFMMRSPEPRGHRRH